MHKMAELPAPMRHLELSINPQITSGPSPDDRRPVISELASDPSPGAPTQATATNTQSDANTFGPTPSAPPPAYVPSSLECRSSRIYDFDDLTSDLERAAPPPPYVAPLMQQSMGMPFGQDPHSTEGAERTQYEDMTAYIKAAKRRRMCAAITLAAIIIVGIILIGNFIARIGNSNSSDQSGPK
ncbi:hypothetical protein Dda_5236 [Drechslerella dactyloides]|uniref:Uncharacterized protein n=1 Tax=Drechslerella dactyloides TaxID=74499 RepID=A0AAD6NK10_DREDA|nr:hypothetical protein Dda_5236 [Drechslerella dactyloides]